MAYPRRSSDVHMFRRDSHAHEDESVPPPTGVQKDVVRQAGESDILRESRLAQDLSRSNGSITQGISKLSLVTMMYLKNKMMGLRLRYVLVISVLLVVAAATLIRTFILRRYESEILHMASVFGVVYYDTECNSAGTPLSGRSEATGTGAKLRTAVPQSMVEKFHRFFSPIIVYAQLNAGNVTDESIEVLADYDRIKQLYICDNEVSSASVESLARMSKLNKVNLLGTKLTSEDVNRLRVLRPDLEIVWFETKPFPPGMGLEVD